MSKEAGLAPLTSWLTGYGEADKRDRHDTGSVLLDYMLKQRPFANGAHLGLIAVVVALVWGSVPNGVLLAWAISVALAGTLSGMIVRRARDDKGHAMARLRFVVTVIGGMFGL